MLPVRAMRSMVLVGLVVVREREVGGDGGDGGEGEELGGLL